MSYVQSIPPHDIEAHLAEHDNKSILEFHQLRLGRRRQIDPDRADCFTMRSWSSRTSSQTSGASAPPAPPTARD